MFNTEYVTTPQNDERQLEQIKIEYETPPSINLAHGIQKDAIQNSFGARVTKNERKACDDWRVTFELININGSDALVFWDEGTTGLIGNILSVQMIENRSSSGELGPEQKLGRFLTRFESGENLGAGTFGRGKLIFHCGSSSWKILVDSLRVNDNQYIAFERFIDNTRLKQSKMPAVGEDAKNFIIENSNGTLKPLINPGTRITILNLRPEVSQAIRNVFTSEQKETDYHDNFSKMIQETWWELLQFNAKIFINYKDKSHQVELVDPLKRYFVSKDKEKGIRIHSKKLLPVRIGSKRYRIKELKFIVTPDNIHEDLRSFWVQRKRMKIGSMLRVLDLHHTLQKKFMGYVILDNALEDVFEKAENVTHYGFHLSKQGIRQIRDIVESELRKFEEELGIKSVSKDASSRKELLDALSDINVFAKDLGLLTNTSLGSRGKNISIYLNEIILPHKNINRVELNDMLGPIIYKLNNNTGVSQSMRLQVFTKQDKRAQLKNIYDKDIELVSQEQKLVQIHEFKLNASDFENYSFFTIVAQVLKIESNEIIDRTSVKIYLGIDPPKKSEKVKISLECKFPKKETRRVDPGEVIQNIRVKLRNETASNLKLGLNLSVRQSANKEIDHQALPLFDLISNKKVELNALSDYVYDGIDDIYISDEKFKSILESEINISERKCEISGKIRLEEKCEDLNLPKHEKMDKSTVVFFIDIDPPGQSIFNAIDLVKDKSENRRSWHGGSNESGYTFYLNVSHPYYNHIRDSNLSDMVKLYEKEQLLTQAYYISTEEGNFSGPATLVKESLSEDSMTTKIMVSKQFDELLGAALKQLLEMK